MKYLVNTGHRGSWLVRLFQAKQETEEQLSYCSYLREEFTSCACWEQSSLVSVRGIHIAQSINVAMHV